MNPIKHFAYNLINPYKNDYNVDIRGTNHIEKDEITISLCFLHKNYNDVFGTEFVIKQDDCIFPIAAIFEVFRHNLPQFISKGLTDMEINYPAMFNYKLHISINPNKKGTIMIAYAGFKYSIIKKFLIETIIELPKNIAVEYLQKLINEKNKTIENYKMILENANKPAGI